ncbi:MAG TPA: AAA family ATPase [Actinomycetes bacterium]|nr:AAA family ATPase [Actinomycetes bacterium]
MNNAFRYSLRKALKLLLAVGILWLITIPILYWMYKGNRGVDWWNILGGDPRVSPEYRGYLIKTGHPLAPHFDIWKATVGAPSQLLGWLMYLMFFLLIGIVQILGIFLFLARGRQYTIYPREYDVGFDDVRGQPEIVESTKEALTLFQGFKKFRDAGGYPPHGILFEGPPGTGKTLLGKAIAGSAKVPFLYASGTSFNNMFLGVGNIRIARLFRRARKMSQRYGGAVIFIDELDAVAGSRGGISPTMDASPSQQGLMRFIVPGGMGMGSMYVNELLIQMDGLTMPKGFWRHVKRILHLGKPKIPQYNVMVIGATNQASTLDPAVLRPGRFDRKLHVGLPRATGREDILEYYLAKVPHEDVDVARLARATYGFSPAQIKNLVNEALIMALIDGRERLNFSDLWSAKVAEQFGIKDSNKPSTRDRQMVAFHEAGHAVLSYVLLTDHQLGIATIVPRGGTGGHVSPIPLEESFTELSEDKRRWIVVFLGGLAAEEIWFGDSTHGPGSDLANATLIAARMLGNYAMGESVLSYAILGDNPYTGGELQAALHDPHTRDAIRELLADCKREAVELLRRNEPAVRALAERLLEKEEIYGEEIEELMQAKAVARARPAFRPALELIGEDWHEPALIEPSQREALPLPEPSHPNGQERRPNAPRPPAEPRSGREFEW